MTIVSRRVMSVEVVLEAGTMTELEAAWPALWLRLEKVGRPLPADLGVRILRAELRREEVRA